MESGHSLYYFMLGAAGAGAVELLKLYEYKHKLTLSKYRKLMVSPLFWSAVLGMLLASGFVAWAIHAESPEATPFQLIIAGIGARSLARSSTAAGVSRQSIHLGEEADEKVSLRDIFL